MAILGTPTKAVGAMLGDPGPAPPVGAHSRQVLSEVLEYESERIKRLFSEGVVAGS
jgi:crotonobetainyl-CoA:carnitine CoA-transferase CaiB-like acyl-CoA transferase